MDGNFDYKKIRKNYAKNETLVLTHAIDKQTEKIIWSLKRLAKIDRRGYNQNLRIVQLMLETVENL